jgi:hypothetical protein
MTSPFLRDEQSPPENLEQGRPSAPMHPGCLRCRVPRKAVCLVNPHNKCPYSVQPGDGTVGGRRRLINHRDGPGETQPCHPSPALRQKFMCLPHSKCRETGGLQLGSQCLPFRNLVIMHLTLILLLIFRFSSLYL